jgi:hypothetical protein
MMMFRSMQGFRAVLILIYLSLAFLIILTGCTEEKQVSAKCDIDIKLNISKPELMANNVTINGGVVAPVKRIQWDWGDGRIEKHRYFPAKHSYEKPGQYDIKVTAFAGKGCSEEKSVTVEIK